MKISNELMDKAGIKAELKLATKEEGKAPVSTGPHQVKIISERIVKGKEYQSNAERDEMEYTFEEDGIEKTYNVPIKDKKGELHYLIQRFAEIPEGTELILEVKKSGMNNYVDIQHVDKPTTSSEVPSVSYGEDVPSPKQDGPEQNVDVVPPYER